MATSTEAGPERALVVDCSICLAWFLPDEQSDLAQELLDRLGRLDFWVPPLWRLELANGINLALRKGRLDAQDRARYLESIERLPILLDPTVPTVTELAELAATHRLTTYDAAYLELALRRRMPLATLDVDLAAAAAERGVLFRLAPEGGASRSTPPTAER